MKSLVIEVFSPDAHLNNKLKKDFQLTENVKVVYQSDVSYKSIQENTPDLFKQVELLLPLTTHYLIQFAKDIPKDVIASLIVEWIKTILNKKDANIHIYGNKPNDGSGLNIEYRKTTTIDLEKQKKTIEEFLKIRT